MGNVTEVDAGLIELATRCGVATTYTDWAGRQVDTPESTLVAVLRALGVQADTAQQRSDALVAHDNAYWAKALPPTIVGRAGADTSFWVHVTHGEAAHIWVRLEDGTV